MRAGSFCLLLFIIWGKFFKIISDEIILVGIMQQLASLNVFAVLSEQTDKWQHDACGQVIAESCGIFFYYWCPLNFFYLYLFVHFYLSVFKIYYFFVKHIP